MYSKSNSTAGNDLRVSWQANAGNFGNLSEKLANSLLVNIERQVANEEGLTLRADGVAVTRSAVSSTVLRVSLGGASVGIVEVQSAAIKLLALHSLVGLGGRLRVSKVDVAEATAAASAPLSDDAGADEATEALEGLRQALVGHVPAQAAGEQSGGSIRLGLLGGVINLLLSLALLGRLSGLGLLLLGGVAVIRVVRVGVRAILGVRVRVGIVLIFHG